MIAPRILLAALALAFGLGLSGTRLSPATQDEKPLVLAVIVNAKNPVADPTFIELREYLRLDQKFWPKPRRLINLYLPPPDSREEDVLLKVVYKMTSRLLDQYWKGKVNRGDLTTRPAIAPSPRKAAKIVMRNEAALCVVPAGDVPEGVRVLRIDGKKPGDEGYPLVLGAADHEPPAID